MTATDTAGSAYDVATGAEDVAWDLDSLLGDDDVDSLVARAQDQARSLTADCKGRVADLDACFPFPVLTVTAPVRCFG